MPKASKGSSFERELCKSLSLWWTNGDSDDIFWRSTTSGARATSRRKQGKKTFGQDGDITATNPIGQPFLDLFCIEAKRGYNKATIQDCLDPAEGMKVQPFAQFGDQAVRSHKNAESKSWMLIHKRDRRQMMVYLPRQTMHRLVRKQPIEEIVKLKKCVCLFPVSGETGIHYICGLPFDNFFSFVTPELIKEDVSSYG